MPIKDPEKRREYQRKLMARRRAKDPKYGKGPTIVSLDDPGVRRQLDEISYREWREARRR